MAQEGAAAAVSEPLVAAEEGEPSPPLPPPKAKQLASLGPAALAVLVAVLGPFSFGYSMGYTSPVLEEVKQSLHLSTSAGSFFGALINLGAMAGAVSGGHLADRWGRKGALVAASACHAIGWILIIVSTSLWPLDIGRFLVGVGTGIVSFAVPVYLAEVAPTELRGIIGTCNQLAVTAGILVVYLAGLGLRWRPLAAVGIVPPVLLLLGLAAVPESPRWLMTRNGKAAAAAALQRLRGPGHDVGDEAEEIATAVALQEQENARPATLKDLWAPSLAMPLSVGIGLMILQQCSGVNSVTFYTGTIFATAGFRSANLAGCLVMAVQVAMTAVAASLMDRAGRKVLLLISSGGMALGAFLLGLSFYLQSLPEGSAAFAASGPLALASLLLYIVAFSLGIGAIPWLIMAEIFPAHVRGVAGSTATLVNWFCSFLVTECFAYLLQWSHPGAFWLYSLICALGVVFIATLVPETKGRSLEEIEAAFKRR